MISSNFKVLYFALCLGVISCNQNQSKKIPVISSKFQNLEVKKELEGMDIRSHLNKKVNLYNFSDKLQLINFFFVSCPTICPAMENELTPLASEYKEKDVIFLSFTINPESDDIESLNIHAKKIKSGQNRLFLRTNKNNIEKLASLYLAQIKNGDDKLFYHTSQVVLLDKSMKIRGLYDILNKDEVDLLEEDIEILLKN